VGLTANHVGSRVDTDFSSFPAARVTLEGYTTLDLDVQVPVHAFLATLRVENMADTEYTSVVGFPGKGRMVFLGLRWNP
jgi:outer membrane cobalamin receptor